MGTAIWCSVQYLPKADGVRSEGFAVECLSRIRQRRRHLPARSSSDLDPCCPQSSSFADAKATASSTRSQIVTATSLSIPGPVQGGFSQWPTSQISSGVHGNPHALPADFLEKAGFEVFLS